MSEHDISSFSKEIKWCFQKARKTNSEVIDSDEFGAEGKMETYDFVGAVPPAMLEKMCDDLKMTHSGKDSVYTKHFKGGSEIVLRKSPYNNTKCHIIFTVYDIKKILDKKKADSWMSESIQTRSFIDILTENIA